MQESPPTTVPLRLTSVDSLRGLAAMLVLCFHAREVLWIGPRYFWERFGLAAPPEAWLGYLSFPLRFGHVGVTLFFVLSGYCVHRSHLRFMKARSGLQLATFFSRRATRIYPTLLAALILTYFADAYVQRHFPADDKLGDLSLTVFLANLASLQNILTPVYGSNVPLWSLSIEVHLYLIYPLLLLIRRSSSAGVVLLCTLIVSLIAIVAVQLGAQKVDFLPYWFGWTAGLYLAEREAGQACTPKLPWGWFSGAAAALALALFITGGAVLSLLASLLLSVPFAALIAWSISPAGEGFWSRRAGRTLALVGVFSYSLYASHGPVLGLLRAVFLDGQRSTNIIVAISGILPCIAIGALLYAFVERWSITSPQRVVAQSAQPAG